MIRESAILVLIGVGMGILPAGAQDPANDAQVRALKVLRDTLLEQERRGTKTITNPPPPAVLSFEHLERLYLDGKLTARQFQQYVMDYKLVRPQPVAATNLPAPVRRADATPLTAGAATNAPPLMEANGEDTAAQARLAELEAKMDELLRLRTNRAELETNTPPATAGPKTKRERLDELLRLLIAGKVSQAEYETRRAKIIAEPDTNRK